VAVEVSEPAPDVVQVEVSDTGVGIAEEHQELVFEEFFQVPGPLQVRRAGTGLGLAHVRRVVDALGGVLTLHSEPGHGSTFTLRLPAGPDRQPTTGLGVVLVADDDPAARQLLRGLLVGLADRVLEAADAPQAIAVAREQRPDLLLLDLRMPGGGAEAVLAALAGAVPVVVVTSAEPDDEARRRIVRRIPVRSKEGLRRNDLLTAVQLARGQVNG